MTFFIDLITGQHILVTKKYCICMDYCICKSFLENWMDRWFMVFDKPPHNNGGGPIVFPQKNICWIVLGLHVNNFDIVELQIVGFDFA